MKVIKMKTGLYAIIAASAIFAGCASTPDFMCTASRNVTLLPGAMLLDVRTQEEYDKKHLEGAILIPHDKVKNHIAGFTADKDALIYVYCGSGRRAEKAVKDLNSIGYRNVINLCGITAALMMVVMMLGSMEPVRTTAAP